MPRATTLLLVLLLAACDGPTVYGDAGPPANFDPYVALADPLVIARRLPGRMRLASSREVEGPEGNLNEDHTRYVYEEPGRHVLAELRGPGVITRAWFTGREPSTQDYSVMDHVVLHAVIDGVDVVFEGDAPGVRLGRLTSGDLPGFTPTWVANRSRASEGLLVYVPLGFQESATLWVEDVPGVDTLFYYQLDWRELPPGSTVPSFTGRLTAAQLRALEEGARFLEGQLDAVEVAPTSLVVTPTEPAVARLAGPTVVRELSARRATEDRGALLVTLRLDGAVVVEAQPLERVFFAPAPTEPFTSAFAGVEPSLLRLRYPVAVHDELIVELRVVPGATDDVPVEVELSHDRSLALDELGRLRAQCQELRTPAIGQNFSVLTVDGEAGDYVGQSLSIRTETRGYWVLEGDHELYVDGEEPVLGTGLEDYFGGAFYYLHGPMRLPLAGATGGGTLEPDGAQVAQYRHHLLGTIPFLESFDFTVETYQDDQTIESCAFWYAR